MDRQAPAKVQKTPARVNHLQTQSAQSSPAANPLLELQRSIGNQAVQRLIRSPYIQTKLQVSTPADPYEQEADRVADTVMRMPDPKTTAVGATQVQAKPLATRITRLVQRATEEPSEAEKEETVAPKAVVQRAVSIAVREYDEEEKIATKLDTGLAPQEEEEEKTVATKLATDAPLQRQANEEDEREEETLQTSPIQRQTEEEEVEKVQTKSLSSQLSHSPRIHSVHRSASAVIQRLCTECEEEKEQTEGQSGNMVQRKSAPEQPPDDDDVEEQQVQPKGAQTATPSVTSSVAANIHAMNGGGSALPDTTRAFFEPRFGADFSSVRVHTDSRAAETAKSISARAFTVGQNIAFGTGQYTPESRQGRHVLAHELAHTIQQRSGPTTGPAATDLNVSHPADSAEQEAGAAADAVLAGRNFPVRASSGVMLSRDGDDEPEQAERRQSEVQMTIRQMISVLSSINVVDAEVEFLFWTSHGAITLVNFRRTQQGGRVVRPFTSDVLDDLAAAEGRFLPTFIGTHERYIQQTFRRTNRGWQHQSWGTAMPQGAPARPPEARTIPISRQGYSVETFSRSSEVASAIIPHLRVPRNSTAELVATFELDDDRIVSWIPSSYQAPEAHPSRPAVPASPDFSFNIHAILLPLTSGLGRRTVRMTLRGRHSGEAANSTWDVTEAGVVRPAGPAVDEASEIVNEYRRTHEQILVQWRQGVRDAGVYVAMIGLREAALWLVGGVVFRVLGVGIRAVAPRLFRLISPRTLAAAEYAETLFVRLLPAEKAEFRAIAAKAETEGIQALSVAERARLDAIWIRMEQLIASPITNIEKGYLRTAMHGRYQAVRAAEVAAFEAASRAYQVHHRLPLEYGHLFPGFDVNTASNLIGLDLTVHRGVNAVWTRFRTLPAGRITPQAVNQVAEIVDRQFARWYHQVPSAQGLGATVEAAKNSGLREVDTLIRTLSR
jgi:hypothetical protein